MIRSAKYGKLPHLYAFAYAIEDSGGWHRTSGRSDEKLNHLD